MIEAVQRQDYDGFTDWLITRDNPHTGGYVYGNVQLAYAKMRRTVEREGYAAVWIVEADTIPPADALSKLSETMEQSGADVVTALYVLRHGVLAPNLFRAGRSPDLGSGLDWKDILPLKGQTVRVGGGCMGCVLARPAALEFDFMILPAGDGRTLAPDVEWMRHNWKAGKLTLARLDVLCGHKDVDGSILHPREYGMT